MNTVGGEIYGGEIYDDEI